MKTLAIPGAEPRVSVAKARDLCRAAADVSRRLNELKTPAIVTVADAQRLSDVVVALDALLDGVEALPEIEAEPDDLSPQDLAEVERVVAGRIRRATAVGQPAARQWTLMHHMARELRRRRGA